MCKVLLERNNKNAGFILFNYLYNLEKDTFTFDDVTEMYKTFGFDLKKDAIKNVVNEMIMDGLIMQGPGYYIRDFSNYV